MRNRGGSLQVQVFAGRDPSPAASGGSAARSAGRPRPPGARPRGSRPSSWSRLTVVSAATDVRERLASWSTSGWSGANRPADLARHRGQLPRRHRHRYITPNLGRAKVHEVDAATLDTLYARVRATGGKCRHCWKRIRRGEPALRAGVRYRPRPRADEAVHEPDCARGWPVSASAVREVHSVLSGAFKQAVVWGWTTHNPARLATPLHRGGC
jgi:hypothetical protein